MAFDTKVHVKNPRNGRIDRVQPYKLHVSRNPGELESTHIFERDKKFYSPDGTEVQSPGHLKKNAKQAG